MSICISIVFFSDLCGCCVSHDTFRPVTGCLTDESDSTARAQGHSRAGDARESAAGARVNVGRGHLCHCGKKAAVGMFMHFPVEGKV